MSGRVWMRGAGIAIGAAWLGAAAPAGVPAALARIEPGEWLLKPVGAGAMPHPVCISNATTLLHFGRRGANCAHVVKIDQPDIVSVEYRCGGSGTGRATLRVETPHSFDLELQGLDGGLPFEDRYEGHRLRDCAH